MATRGYTDQALIEAELRRDLTDFELELIDLYIEGSEQRIDIYTGKRFLTGAVVNERHPVLGTLQLGSSPIISVESVIGHRRFLDPSNNITLTTPYDYEVDLDLGVVYVRNYGVSTNIYGEPDLGFHQHAFDDLLVSYTTAVITADAPALLKLAATKLVVYWLANGTQPELLGIKSYSVGAELSVQYFDLKALGGYILPREILDLLSGFRKKLVFA